VTRFILPIVVFVALAGVLFVGVRNSTTRGTLPSALLGKPAPAFELPELGAPGKTVSLRQFAGKPFVLNVWATWCVACREEHPTLLDIASTRAVTLVGLDYKDKDDEAIGWLKQFGNPYDVIAVDAEGRTAIDFGVYGAPETFFIDASGRVLYRHVGAMTPEVWQREFVARIKGTKR
jgi:cytochrome c biogenesis protein CcmG/thiol:disulfide interchange protein DsbE